MGLEVLFHLIPEALLQWLRPPLGGQGESLPQPGRGHAERSCADKTCWPRAVGLCWQVRCSPPGFRFWPWSCDKFWSYHSKAEKLFYSLNHRRRQSRKFCDITTPTWERLVMQTSQGEVNCYFYCLLQPTKARPQRSSSVFVQFLPLLWKPKEITGFPRISTAEARNLVLAGWPRSGNPNW